MSTMSTIRAPREKVMQDELMKFDPATGEERPYPSHAAQWRNWHGVAAWLFDPWTGKRRNAYDVGSDVHGLLIVPAGTLGGDTGGGASKQNKHEAMVCAQRPPTPVGWSDTDWIKHLQEQEKPHPLAGQHINQGSMDAAADAYEAEYYDSLKRDAERYRWLRGDACPDHSVRWTQWDVRCWVAPFWSDDLRREGLDRSIDAAMAAEQNNERREK